MENNPTEMQFPIGTYMLLWFTNPDKRLEENGALYQGLCSELHISLKDAENSAELLSGNRIILMCTAQNPSPDKNVYWDAVKRYGESFELNELSVLSDSLRQAFLNKKNNQ